MKINAIQLNNNYFKPNNKLTKPQPFKGNEENSTTISGDVTQFKNTAATDDKIVNKTPIQSFLSKIFKSPEIDIFDPRLMSDQELIDYYCGLQ